MLFFFAFIHIDLDPIRIKIDPTTAARRWPYWIPTKRLLHVITPWDQGTKGDSKQ
jgi:hypothetical protein